MRRLLPAFVLMLLVLPSFAAEPFAPMAKLPAGVKADPMTRSMLEHSRWPTRQEVPVPAYPGSKFIAAYPVNIGGADQPEQMILRLVSEDAPEKVVAFYTEALTGFSNAKSGILHTFWKGEGIFAAGSPEAQREMVPWLVIMQNPNPEYWPWAKSHIEISYRP